MKEPRDLIPGLLYCGGILAGREGLFEGGGVGAFGGNGGEGGGFFAVGAFGVLGVDGLSEGFNGGGGGECDDAAAEATAGHAGAEDAGNLAGDVDEGVEFGAGDGVIVAEGSVGVVHVFAAGAVVAVGEGVGEVGGAGNFGDDVAGAAEAGGVHAEAAVFEEIHVDVAEGFDVGVLALDVGESGFALVTAGGVFAGDEFVFDVGVGDDDAEVLVIEGDLSGGAVAAVDEEGVAFFAHGGDELVHDAAGHAGIVVLGPLAGECEFDEVHGFVVDGEECEGGGDFDGGGGGEAAAEGDVGIDEGVHALGDLGALAHGFCGALGVEGPGGAVLRDFAVDGELDGFVGVGGVHADFAVGARGANDEGGFIDGHGADEAVVVVDVFTDEIDAAGCTDGEELGGVGVGEEGEELLAKYGDVHGLNSPIFTTKGPDVGEVLS